MPFLLAQFLIEKHITNPLIKLVCSCTLYIHLSLSLSIIITIQFIPNFLTDAPKESYEVGDLAPDNVDFGVRISGDSMEPEYYNGEIAWIQQKDSICNGEVGIFYLNGDAYIKKLHDEPDGLFLISLNKKYKPIAIQESDSFKIFGRVVGKCDASDIPGFQ